MSILYLIRHGGTTRYKIGRTNDVARRLKELVTGNPVPLRVVKTWDAPAIASLEHLVHAHFDQSGQRFRGSAATEYFVIDDEAAGIRAIDALHAEHLESVARHAAVRGVRQTSTDTVEATPEIAELVRQRRQLAGLQSVLRHRMGVLDARIQAAIGERAGLTIDDRRAATWSDVASTRFSEADFARDHPELHRAYKRARITRRFNVM